jgi:hypothetical protein
MRALGRLAFCDHYLTISRRLREELMACTNPDALTAAAKNTRLGPRTNQPRVYVITGLAGGTGGGMFLDLAYVARSLLKSLGFEQPDVVGLFLLPRVDRNPARSLALGNAYAALTELNHYSSGGIFSARYHAREPGIRDAKPPYRRCVLLPLPPEGNAAEAGQAAAQAGEFVWRDLFTPLGRTADERRLAQGGTPKGASLQTYGLYRFCSPRRPLLRKTARHICRELVKQWMTRDARPIIAAVETWVRDHWSREEFGTEAFIGRLQDACAHALGQAPETQFAALVAPITQAREPVVELAAAEEALADLAKYLGPPLEETVSNQAGVAEVTLAEASETLVNEWGQRLSEIIVKLIEEPAYRLAGAEEAIRQVMASIEKTLQHHEPLCKELAQSAYDAYVRVHQLLDGLNRNVHPRARVPAVVAELRQLLASYPKWRYQFLILRQMSRGYISLRGNLSDELREVGFCRARLGELLKAYEEPTTFGKAETPTPEARLIPGRVVFSTGCTDLGEAVKLLLRQITTAQYEDLHERVQAMIRKQFMALIQVCLGSANLVKDLEGAMQQEVEAFLASCSEGHNVADLLLQQYPGEDEALNEISTAFDEAVPELAGVHVEQSSEVCILSVPPGPAGDRVVALARRAVPNAAPIPASTGEEILLYREWPLLDPARLEQLGPLGREAYRQMLQVEHYSPHSRNDVSFRDV